MLNVRRLLARVTTVLACLLVLVVLVVPYDLEKITAWDLARIPLEGVLGLALLLALPERWRKVGVVVGGVVLGALAIVKIMDMGFDAVLYRPFDLVLDWPLFGPAVDYVDVTIGRFAAIGAVVGAVALTVGIIVLVTLAVRRLTRVAVGRRTAATHTVRAFGITWLICAVLGAPFASQGAAALAYDHAHQVRKGLQDQEAFAREIAVDAFRNTPADQLLTGLRGKDVAVTFVESYGRNAVEDPEVRRTLDDGTARLKAEGFQSRSGFLTSPTAGGGSWMAQATLLSGVWIDNQQRYRNLVASDRLTLNRAFQRADWRTVGVMPGITQAWPEGRFFGYDKIYDAADLEYRGPRFGYATMPDQYTLSKFQRSELADDHKPVMAAIPLLSSHAPWDPIPSQLEWDEVGDGSVFHQMANSNDPPESIFGRDPVEVRADYRKSVQYTLNNLVSYVETHGDDNTVLVFLGDHQPAQMVTGENATKDVPITIVAKDPAVLERVSGWGWNDGIRPNPQAPVWPMSDFRDRFLTAFGPKDQAS